MTPEERAERAAAAAEVAPLLLGAIAIDLTDEEAQRLARAFFRADEGEAP